MDAFDRPPDGPPPELVSRYLDRLAAELHSHGVDPVTVGEVVAETHAHLDDGGENPVEAFGDPEDYASRLAEALPPYDPARWEHRTFTATAIDELSLLDQVGRQGWELIGCGAFALHCRRPRHRRRPGGAPPPHQWEYRRKMSVRPAETPRRCESKVGSRQAPGHRSCT